MYRFRVAQLVLLFAAVVSRAQDTKPSDAMDGMKMDSGMQELMSNMQPQTFLQQIEHHASSGTSAEPFIVISIGVGVEFGSALVPEEAWCSICCRKV